MRFWPSQDGRLTILPGAWSLDSMRDPEDSIRDLLIICHDMEGDGHDCQDQRETLLELSNGLKSTSVLHRSKNGDVLVRVMVDNIPIGMRREISERPSLNEILQIAWDTLADCTIGIDWIHSWYLTKIEISSRLGDKDEIILHCMLAK